MEARIRELTHIVVKQQRQIGSLSRLSDYLVRSHDALRRDHEEAQAAHKVLCDYLCDAGAIRQADLRRRRLASRIAEQFSAVLEEPNLAHALAVLAGDTAARNLSAASRACVESLSVVGHTGVGRCTSSQSSSLTPPPSPSAAAGPDGWQQQRGAGQYGDPVADFSPLGSGAGLVGGCAGHGPCVGDTALRQCSTTSHTSSGSKCAVSSKLSGAYAANDSGAVASSSRAFLSADSTECLVSPSQSCSNSDTDSPDASDWENLAGSGAAADGGAPVGTPRAPAADSALPFHLLLQTPRAVVAVIQHSDLDSADCLLCASRHCSQSVCSAQLSAWPLSAMVTPRELSQVDARSQGGDDASPVSFDGLLRHSAFSSVLGEMMGVTVVCRFLTTSRLGYTCLYEVVNRLISNWKPKLYVFGGVDPDMMPVAQVERFAIGGDQWEVLPPMPAPRTGFATAAIDGQIYLIGGLDQHYCPAGCERYDPPSGQWESLPPMLRPCISCSATAMGGVLFVVGLGRVGTQSNSFVVCECFDPASCKWSALEPPPLHECSAAVGALGCLYAISGFEWVCACLDPCAGEWADLPPISTAAARHQVPCEIVAGAAMAGRIYFFGSTISDICIFDICANTWEIPSLGAWLPYTVRESRTSCAVATSGRLYVFCTYEDKLRQRAVSGAAVFDPDAQPFFQWTLSPTCHAQRGGLFSAVVAT